MLRCLMACTMLMRDCISTAGHGSVPTASELSQPDDLPDDIATGSRKVSMVCDQWVFGWYGDVDKLVGISLQNLPVNPVSNHKTSP